MASRSKNNVQTNTYERSERGSKIRFILPSLIGGMNLVSFAIAFSPL